MSAISELFDYPSAFEVKVGVDTRLQVETQMSLTHRVLFRTLSHLDQLRSSLRDPEYRILSSEILYHDQTHQLKASSLRFLHFQIRDSAFQPPIVIMSPTIAGVTFFELLIARLFIRRGIECLIPLAGEDPTTLSRSVFGLRDLHVQMVTRLRHLIDYASSFTTIEKTPIIGYGASLGGSMMASTFALDPRLDSAILIVSGGNLPEMWSYSKNKAAARYRKHRMQVENFQTELEFLAEAKKISDFDPVHFAAKTETRPLFMLMARQDRDVPYENQRVLWQAFGKPKKVEFSLGHIPSVLVSTQYIDLALKHCLGTCAFFGEVQYAHPN